jgi:hypothetical protein
MSVNIEQIDPFLLSSVALGQRDFLPVINAIYFAIKDTEILYIGKASNLYQRWQRHHRINQLQSFDNVIIAWLPIVDLGDIDKLEEACIKRFNPLLNSVVIPKELTLGDKRKPTSIRLSEDAMQLRKLLAQHLGVSESAVIELAIRELAERKGIQMSNPLCRVLLEGETKPRENVEVFTNNQSEGLAFLGDRQVHVTEGWGGWYESGMQLLEAEARLTKKVVQK